MDLNGLDAVCARGGQLPYCAAGTYQVDQDMVDFMYTVRDAAHASNLGCVLALRIARPLGIPAFICDPVTVDEMTDEARMSGLPELPRMMTGHALNCRAMAMRCASEVLHKPLADCLAHRAASGRRRLCPAVYRREDGGRRPGRRVDVRAGAHGRREFAAAGGYVLSGEYTKQDIMSFIRGKGRAGGASGHRRRHRGGAAHPGGRPARQACTTGCCTAAPALWAGWRLPQTEGWIG